MITANSASALTASAETAAGTTTFIETLSVDGDLGSAEALSLTHPNQWGWSGSYSYTRTDTAQSGQTSLLDETSELAGGVDWSGVSGWLASGDVSYANTPQESLRTTGAGFNVGYKFQDKPSDLGAKPAAPSVTVPAMAAADEMTANEMMADDDDGEDAEAPSVPFRSWWRVRLGAEFHNYEEVYGTITARRKNITVARPVTGSDLLGQRTVTVDLKSAPLERWRFSGSIAHSTYDRDVAKFLANLDSPRAVQTGRSGISNTVGGLPLVSYGVGVNVELTELIGFHATETYAITAADLSKSYATKGVFELQLREAFRLSFGAEYTSSAIAYETLGLIALEGDF